MARIKITTGFTFLVLLLILSPNAMADDNATVHILPATTKEDTTTISGTIFTQVKVSDNSNRITEIDITLSPKYDTILEGYTIYDTGVLVNLSDNFTYMMNENNFNYLGFIPYHTITQSVFFQNYTIFSNNITTNNLMPQNMHAKISYDINTKNTTFEIYTSLVDSEKYSTNFYVGMPADVILLNGMSQFDAKITYVNVGNVISIQEQVDSLSGTSKLIYDILTGTVNLPIVGEVSLFGDSPTLLSVLKMLDFFFLTLNLTYQIMFVYPYLVVTWIVIILPNFYTAYMSNTIRELVLNYGMYFIAIGKGAVSIGRYIFQTVIWFLNAIFNLIP